MKNIINITLFLLILGISCANMDSASANKLDSSQSATKKGHVSKEILVKFKPGTDADMIKEIQEKTGLVTVRNLSVPDLYLMKITDKTSVEEIIKELKKYSEVLYAEPNYKYRTNTK